MLQHQNRTNPPIFGSSNICIVMRGAMLRINSLYNRCKRESFSYDVRIKRELQYSREVMDLDISVHLSFTLSIASYMSFFIILLVFV